MAYTPCAAQLAANITIDCANPIVGGYTGEGVIIPLSSVNPTIVKDAENPRMITTLSVGESDKVVVVDNVFAEPLSGSTTTGNAEAGRPQYVKTIALRVPMRGAEVSKDIIEPMFNSPEGFIGIFPKKDKNNDGAFEIVGLYQAMKGDISTLTRDENTNGGDWSLSLVATEPFAEVTLVGEEKTYASAKAMYDALVAKAY